MPDEIRYVLTADAFLSNTVNGSPKHNLLLGGRLHVDTSQEQSGWVPARTVPDEQGNSKTGFVETAKISPTQQLKVFYLDVGQGDATLIEAEGAVVIIDGGPNQGFYDVLKSRLQEARRADEDVGLPPRPNMFVNAVVVTHFDQDHYFGLRKLFEDDDFRFGTLYHNGIPRYGAPANKDLDLGDVVNHQDGTRSISTDLTDFDSAQALLDDGLLLTENGNPNNFAKFLQAVLDARTDNRVQSMKRLNRRDASASVELLPDVGNDLEFEILAPVTTKTTDGIRLPVFPDPEDVTPTNPNPPPSDSHTINGNSVVLRLRYKNKLFLFGGDLNQPAQKYLEKKYGTANAFKANVNKACHHGSSDFHLQYLKDVAPQATVFSSGDDGNHDHPLPDAMGAAAKHSVGDFPLVFSTELARDNKTSGDILLGHINARSNGTDLIMAQKKERTSQKNPWHTFPLPFQGPFAH